LGAFNDSVLTMVPNLYSKMPWDALKDFEPVSLVGTIEWGLVVKTDSPFKNLEDFIAAAKAAPGKLTYGSGGVGSPQHIGMALLCKRADIKLLHVPYKGATPAAVAAAAGEVDVSLQGLGTAVSLIQGGKLRLLAIATSERLPQFADAPTFAQAGLSGFTFNSWFALVAPAKTPKSIVDRLDTEITAVLADKAISEHLVKLGVTPRGMHPAEFRHALKEQYALYQKVIQEQGIKAE
jgi:tripartite-type tricarboxylate transporter receptor subunit TctC